MGLIRGIIRWFNALSENRLRLIYSAVAVASLVAIGFAAVGTFRYLSVHSDETLWVEMKNKSGEYLTYVVEIVPGGRADLAGIRPGDRVIAIAGKNIGTDSACSWVAQRILDASPVDVPISYVVERDGKILDLPIRFAKVVRFHHLAVPALSLLWLMIGVMVVFSRPRGIVQREFFFLSATSLFALSLISVDATHTIVSGLSTGFVAMLFYIAWVHFFSIFPVDQGLFKTRRGKQILLALPIVLLIVTIANLVLLLGFKVDLGKSYVMGLNYSAFGTVAIYFLAGVWLLYRGYRRMPATADRRPTTVILIGSVLAGLVMVYFAVLRTGRPQSMAVLYPQYLLPMILLLALPISFGYAIFKYQVMDFRTVVRATVTYGATMLLLGALYLGIAFGVGQAFGTLTRQRIGMPVEMLIFVTFVLLFDPIKRYVQNWIENRFFPARRDYSKFLAACTEQVAEAVGTRNVASVMTRTLREALHLKGVWILLESPNSDEPLLVARDTEYPAVTVPGQVLDRVWSAVEGVHTPIRVDTAGDLVPEDLQHYFAYVAGLHAQGKLRGMVFMSETESGQPLSGSQTSFIAGVLTQGASALEVARLYEEELQRQRYEEELNTARRIQESLLPAAMPSIPGISFSAISQPAQTVGGDYYEVIQLAPHRFLVMIADVSGKGLPAALYMAELHGMVRIASAMAASPRAILSVINRHLAQVMERGSFITAALLMFDLERRTVSFARAGQTPIIRRSGTRIDSLVPTGLPLGSRAEDFERFLQEYTVSIEPGETFILYSDGVSEAMNDRRDEFGEGRLMDLLSSAGYNTAEEICDGIRGRIVEFRGGAEPNDDVTIVVIRVEKDGQDFTNSVTGSAAAAAA